MEPVLVLVLIKMFIIDIPSTLATNTAVQLINVSLQHMHSPRKRRVSVHWLCVATHASSTPQSYDFAHRSAGAPFSHAGQRESHVDGFVVALDESKSQTRQHRDALKRQFQWSSWEDADFTICGVQFRQYFVCISGGVRSAWITMVMLMRLNRCSVVRTLKTTRH